MLTDSQIRHGAAAAQGLLNAFGHKLSVDGIWSTLSQGAYDKLSAQQALQVDAVVAAAAQAKAGVTDLARAREAGRASGRAIQATVKVGSKSPDEMRKLITGIALEEGVPASAAIKFATVESRLNPDARSATGASGLFQLTKPAIDQIGLPPPNGNRLDPAWNARVGIKYMKWVARYLNVTFDDVGAIYAGYNLGVGNVARIKRGEYNHPEVQTALGQQAKQLQVGGAKAYLANATRFVNMAVA